jgi:hypothetical protein
MSLIHDVSADALTKNDGKTTEQAALLKKLHSEKIRHVTRWQKKWSTHLFLTAHLSALARPTQEEVKSAWAGKLLY